MIIQIGSLPGVGLNEAAVQLMAARASLEPYENVKYFDINIQTNTPMYYPLECALVNQMAYVIGENVLFDSTLHANNNFRDQYISLTSEREFFRIQRNIDLLVEAQAKLEKLFASLEDIGLEEDFVQKISNQIDYEKNKVKKIFLATQRLILTSYFDNTIKLAYTPKAIENYRNKLYLFKNLIGCTDYDNFYAEYYRDKMMELEKKYEFDPLEKTEIVVYKPSLFTRFVHKIEVLFGLNKVYQNRLNSEYIKRFSFFVYKNNILKYVTKNT